MPRLTAIIDLDGKILTLSPGWKKTLGWDSPQPPSGKKIQDRIHPDTLQDFSSALNAIRENGCLESARIRLLNKEGIYKSYSWHGILHPDQKTFTMVLINRAKKFSDSFSSEIQIKALYESLLEGVLAMGADGKIFHCNPAALQILGYSQDQIMGKGSTTEKNSNWESFNEDLTLCPIQEHPFSVALRTGIPQTKRVIGIQVPVKDGIRWLEVNAVPLFKNDKPYQVVTTFRDITEEKASREELLNLKDQLRRLIDRLPALVAHWDKNLRNVLVNQMYADYFGVQHPSKFKGKHMKDVLGEDLFNKDKKYIDNVLKGLPQSFEREFILPDGELRNTYCNYLPEMVNGEVRGFYVIVTDTTQIKKMEIERREIEAKLTTNSKLATLGEMASCVAHEVNNPLSIILGKIGMIHAHLDRNDIDRAKLKETLYSVEATANRITSIIKGLSTFSREAAGDPMELVPASKIISDTLELCQQRFKNNGIRLITESYPNALVDCRPVQISQILMNLLSNSFEAVRDEEEKWVRIDVELDDQKIKFLITDSGHGIPNDIAEKMMLPFFTTKEVGRGTGLGLSISQGIAGSHHGKLKYDSSSKNTRFILELPLKQPKGES